MLPKESLKQLGATVKVVVCGSFLQLFIAADFRLQQTKIPPSFHLFELATPLKANP